MKRYVIAIGGNALEEKKSSLPKIFRQIAGCIAHLIEKGDSIAIVLAMVPRLENWLCRITMPAKK